MDIYKILFFVILFLPAIIVIIVDKTKGEKIRQEKELQPYFEGNYLEDYETQLAKYLTEIKLETGCTVFDIVKQINYQIQYCKKAELPEGKEAVTQQECNLISVDEQLSSSGRAFAIAHEIGHLARGAVKVVCRAKHPVNRAVIGKEKYDALEEGICDYIAAAIILPYAYMLEEIINEKYNKMGFFKRKKFVEKIAKDRGATRSAVSRRIEEIEKLEKYKKATATN